MNQIRKPSRLSLTVVPATLLVLAGAAAATTPTRPVVQEKPVAQEPAVKPTQKPTPKATGKPVPAKQDGHDHGTAKQPVGGQQHGPGDGHNHGPAKQPVVGKKPNPAAAYSGESDPNAKLAIDFGTEIHDFGKAMQGQILEHTFEMMSGGSSDLVIRQAKPTCGCTVGKVTVENDKGEMGAYTMGDPIAAGRKVNITGSMDTKNKRNQTQVRINVYTNDPVGLTQLGLKALVSPYITATPSFVNFGELSETDSKAATVDFRTGQGEPVMLSEDTTRKIPMPHGMTVELVPVNPNDDGRSHHWQAKVALGPDLKEGPANYTLALTTDKEMVGAKAKPDGSMPRYTISASINARVLGLISCSPQYLSMGLVRPGQVVPRSVRLVSQDADFDLTGVQVEVQGEKGAVFKWSDSFTTEVRPVPGQNAVDVTLRLEGLPADSDGSFKGVMMIKTGHESKGEVPVRFSGVCRAGVVRSARPVAKQPEAKKKAGGSE
jgi:hypothetical protein